MKKLFFILIAIFTVCSSVFGLPPALIGLNVVARTNLVGWWTMNGTNADGSFTDSSGYSNKGTNIASVGFSKGVIGNAATFNGSSQYISTSKTNTAYLTSITVSWWQNPSVAYNSGVARVIWGQLTLTPRSEFSAQVYSDTNWYVGFFTSSDYRVILPAGTSNWFQNTWAFYAITASSAGSIFYVNRLPVKTNSVAPVFVNSVNNFKIGIHDGTAYFAGSIDDVRIYNRVLTATEVASMCYTTNGVTYPVPGK